MKATARKTFVFFALSFLPKLGLDERKKTHQKIKIRLNAQF